MRDPYEDGDWEKPRDDEERKIRSLQRELAAVSKSGDKFILWGIPLVFALILLHYLKPGIIPPIVVAILLGGIVIGGIIGVIAMNIVQKRRVLIRRGIRCTACGHLPGAINAAGVYVARKCPKCGVPLETDR